MQIEILSNELEPAYSAFLLGRESSIVSMSLAYRDLLKELLDAQDHYLIATENEKIIGALPLLIKENDKYGRVYNSLPFYGSNGGLLTSRDDVGVALIEHYLNLLGEEGVAAGTLITSPFEPETNVYEDAMPDALRDYRIGQFTVLASSSAALMAMFHHKTRNAIRKGEKSGLEVDWANGQEFMDFLVETHEENSESIGIPPKPRKFFELLSKHFSYGRDYRIYTASRNGEPFAALLSLYLNKTAEYYTPATVAAYREMQPMSFIIYRAMCDAIENGFKVWNWGGTAESAKGVYDFKKRWGTTDRKYQYYSVLRDPSVRNLSPSELLESYPFFYVLPFSALR
jgi:hypothetical protein